MRMRHCIVLTALALFLCACGSDAADEESDQGQKNEQPAASEPAAETAQAEADAGPVTFKVGVVGGFYLDVFESLAESLAEEGVDLQTEACSFDMVEYLLRDGAIDMTMTPYVRPDDQYAAVGYTIVTPINFYSKKNSSFDQVQPKDQVIVAGLTGILHSPRLQKIMESAGLITLNKEPSSELTVSDINYLKDPYYMMDVTPSEMLKQPEYMDDLGAFTMYGTHEEYNLLMEDPTAEDPEYWGRLVVRMEDTQDEERLAVIRKVVDAFHSQTTIDALAEQGNESQPAGWDVDLISQYQ